VVDFRFTEFPLTTHSAPRQFSPHRHFCDLIWGEVKVLGKLGNIEIFHGLGCFLGSKVTGEPHPS